MRIARDFSVGGWKTGYLLSFAFAFGVYLSLLGTVATILLAGVHAQVNEPSSVPVIAQFPRETEPEDIEKLISSLGRIVGVAEVSILSERELQDLVEPWLSEEVLGELAFFPILVEIIKDGRGDLDRGKLQTVIREIQGGFVMNFPTGQHEQNFGAFIVRGLVHFAMFVLLLSAVVLLVVQMSIFLNLEVVNVLRLLGATDPILIREFRFNMLRVAIIGGCIGSIAAVGTVLLTMLFAPGLGTNELLLSRFNLFSLFFLIMGVAAGPLLTWVLAPTIIGRELTLLKKPRW